MNTMDKCPGDPNGHSWVLKNSDPKFLFYHPTYRSLFTNKIQCHDSVMDGELLTIGINNFWYCSSCRTFDSTYQIVSEITEDDLLACGYAVGNSMPELTTTEAKKLGRTLNKSL